MNIYWYATTDSSYLRGIVAPDEAAAKNKLAELEEDLALDNIPLIGVSEGVDQGQTRGVILVMSHGLPTEIEVA
jgi:hypothetical protein